MQTAGIQASSSTTVIQVRDVRSTNFIGSCFMVHSTFQRILSLVFRSIFLFRRTRPFRIRAQTVRRWSFKWWPGQKRSSERSLVFHPRSALPRMDRYQNRTRTMHFEGVWTSANDPARFDHQCNLLFSRALHFLSCQGEQISGKRKSEVTSCYYSHSEANATVDLSGICLRFESWP